MRIKDMIIADKAGREKGYLDEAATLDLEVGGSHDFELKLPLSDYRNLGYSFGDRIYIPGTEYGGIIADCETSTLEDDVTLRGYTWRGLLARRVIEPPQDKDYLTVSGEANKIIGQVTEGWFDGILTADEADSGFVISDYQFDRYTDGLTGLSDMLKSAGAKLELEYRQTELSGNVILRAVPIYDYSDDVEYSNDNKVHFTTRDYRMGVNHLICLGKGEGKSQLIVHLYLDEKGEVSTQKHFTGIEENTEVYEAASQDNREKLMQSGAEKLLDLMNYTELEMSVQDIEVAAGDIVGGRERMTGLYIRQPVTNKILKLDNDGYSIEYKVGE